MTIAFEHKTDNYIIVLISDEKYHEYRLDKIDQRGNIHKEVGGGVFRNAITMSESLRDDIGYGPAHDLLVEMDVPADHALFSLGRKG